MTPTITAKISEYKKNAVDEMSSLIRKSSITALVDMSNIPAPQLQAMRKEMKGKISLYMTKKRLMRIALDRSKNEKKNIEALANYFEGMPAFIFSNEDPFKLSRLLQKGKTKAPAKPGQTAPSDIIISKGPTPFAPGPIISELSSVGLKVGVEGGKIAIKENAVIARKGERIKPKVAEILARLDIRPMDVGLGMVAAYEDGIIYTRGVLEVDEKAFNNKLNNAAVQAFNLAFNIAYTTKGNIYLLIAKAFNDAKALGLSQNIFDGGIIEHILGKAEREMLSLKHIANIETAEKPKEKEEEILEEEKSIIEEEEKLEKEPIAPVPEEREVQEAVKEEEEKKLENERIEKEKELEEVKGSKERQSENDVDKKISKMVENTKKFVEGKQETASDILNEVSRQEKKENAEQQRKETRIPPAHELNIQKEKKSKEDEKNQKEVEELTKELLRKGTLRK
ncbi:50S ribosomal protein L10 [Candidatus Woesearchaeota archaeon]|nr:50S ribosomal protein L10 [Candidatus Woesearchaeota archaeon]